jgi:hypothetical protein
MVSLAMRLCTAIFTQSMFDSPTASGPADVDIVSSPARRYLKDDILVTDGRCRDEEGAMGAELSLRGSPTCTSILQPRLALLDGVPSFCNPRKSCVPKWSSHHLVQVNVNEYALAKLQVTQFGSTSSLSLVTHGPTNRS